MGASAAAAALAAIAAGELFQTDGENGGYRLRVDAGELPDGLAGPFALQVPHGAVDGISRTTCGQEVLQLFTGNTLAYLISDRIGLFEDAFSSFIQVETHPGPHRADKSILGKLYHQAA